MIDFDSETKVLDIEIFTQLTIADMNSSIAIILLFSQGQKKMHTHTHTRARTHARAYIYICIYIYVYVYICAEGGAHTRAPASFGVQSFGE